MSQMEKTYEIAKRGLGTSFTEVEVPIDYALQFTNRFTNAAGGAEKRQGIVKYLDAIGGSPEITSLHELVTIQDESILLAGANGVIYHASGSAFNQAHVFSDTSSKIRSVQFDTNLLFYNGSDRAVYTDDGVTYQPLVAVLEQGSIASTSASATGTVDSDITNWVGATDAAVGDIVWNVTLSAFGYVTAVTSGRLEHSPITSAGPGSGIGNNGDHNSQSGDSYRLIDTIENDVIQGELGLDNVATGATGTNQTTIVVSASAVTNWQKTEIRRGDYVYNSTRNRLTKIQSVQTSSLTVNSVSAQTAGDSFVFVKDAAPIPSFAHVHYNRVYAVDARNKKRIQISGANDLLDWTGDGTTLESVTLNTGTQQPDASKIQALNTFQSFLVVATEKFTYAYEGIDPIDLQPAGLFPQGAVSPDGLVNAGNDLAIITPDGLMSINLLVNTNNLQRANISEPIKTELRNLIRTVNPNLIGGTNYQRRSWVLVKIGDEMYVYNYTNFVLDDGRLAAGASWSKFTGLLAQQRALLVTKDQDLLLAGAGGQVYKFDQDTYDDDGQVYETAYGTGWLTLEEPRKTRRMKKGNYITPVFEVGAAIPYTIDSHGRFNHESGDTVIVTAAGAGVIGVAVIGQSPIGGSRATDPKTPLRWRGESVRVIFETEDALGPDVLSRFTIFGNLLGRR